MPDENAVPTEVNQVPAVSPAPPSDDASAPKTDVNQGEPSVAVENGEDASEKGLRFEVVKQRQKA